MNNNTLTSVDLWENHWNKFKPTEIKNLKLNDLTYNFPKKGEFIEIGGFPGTYSIYFNKTFGYHCTLLDYVVKNEIINKFEIINGLKENTISVIESDFFRFSSDKKYDIVFSWGFIEHFIDIYDVLKRHSDILNENGQLLVGIPNLRGIAGWFHKIVENDCYKAHNLNCMDIYYLTEICNKLNLKNVEVFYYGKSKIWLNKSSKYDNSLMRGIVWVTNILLKRIKIKNKYLSPHIVIKASK